MTTTTGTIFDFIRDNPYSAPIFASVITAFFAVLVVSVTVYFQSRIAADKIKNDNALKLIEEFFDSDFMNGRQALRRRIDDAQGEHYIDIFSDPGVKLTFRMTANFFEKLNGMILANRVDVRLIQEVLGSRLEFWYVNIVERSETEKAKLNYDWKSSIGRLKKLKDICRQDYLFEERKRLNAVISSARPSSEQRSRG